MEATSNLPPARLTARIPKAVHEVIEQAASWRGVSVNSFIVHAAVKEAEEVIEHERIIRLTQEGAAKLADLLDSPPKPNEKLINAVRRQKDVFEP